MDKLKQQQNTIEESIGKLKSREVAILKYRFGMTDNQVHTLEETGKLFGITRERVRQIESKAVEGGMKKKKYENWEITYDDEIDALYVSEPVIHKKYKLFHIEGINYYVNKNGKIAGIMIEYFSTQIREWFNKNKKVFKKNAECSNCKNEAKVLTP